MRKSSLVKAMACFMAATMAVTCVPGVNVTNGVAVVAEAAETNVQTGTMDKDVSNLTTWASNGVIETLPVGDFDVIFTFESKGGTDFKFNPVIEVTRDDRFVTVRTSKEGWTGGTTAGLEDVVLSHTDFSQPEEEVKKALADATGSVEVVREGKNFTITWEYKSKIEEYKDTIYTRTTSFESEFLSKDSVNIQFGVDQCNLTVKSFANFADYAKDGPVLNVSKNMYEIYKSNEAVVPNADGTVNIDLSKLFNGTAEELKQIENVPVGETQSVSLTVNGVTQTLSYQVIENPCTGIDLTEDYKNNSLENPKSVSVIDSFSFDVELKGGQDNVTVTDPVEAVVASTTGAIATDTETKEKISVEQTKRDGNVVTFTVKPQIATEASIKVTCGECEKLYYFKSEANECDSLIVSDGGATQIDQGVYSISTPITTIDGKLFSFNIRAASSTNKTTKLTDRIERVDTIAKNEEKEVEHIHYFKKGGVKYYPTINRPVKLTKTIYDDDGVLEEQYVAHVYQGNNDFLFKCGDKEIVVRIVGTDGSTSAGTPSAPSTDNTTTDTPETNTPDTTTPGAVTPDTPSTDNNTPSTDNNTPSTDNNTPSTDNNNTSDDNNDDTEKKTTKKKAKVASVTAKKGKKVISGTVKISATGKKVSKATVKVYVNSKKKVTVKTKSSGKFTAKLSKKLKKGDKVKLVITKSNIKKITKTVKIK